MTDVGTKIGSNGIAITATVAPECLYLEASKVATVDTATVSLIRMWTWTRTLQHAQWASLVQPRGARESTPARWHCLVGFPEEEEEQWVLDGLLWKVLVAVASVLTERVVTAPRKQARARTQAEVSMPGSHTRLWRRLDVGVAVDRSSADASDNNSADVVDRRGGYDE